MAEKILKFGLWALGMSAILIGGGIALLGSHAVVSFFESALSLFYEDGPVRNFTSPNIDSELRFYSIMFVFYGGVLIQTAKNLNLYATRVPILLAVFFVGGVARLNSYLSVGTPHALFALLMAVEIILPLVLFTCWKLRKT